MHDYFHYNIIQSIIITVINTIPLVDITVI